MTAVKKPAAKKQPDFSIESNHLKSTGSDVVGVDEAGRGPLAGPVVAAAVILDVFALDLGINDSKKLSVKKRNELFLLITERYKYSVGIASVEEIDSLNILNATMLAMKRAIIGLDINHNTILIDGNITPFSAKNIIPIIGGDAKSITIAAASIVAKVTRDRMMTDLDKDFPQYGWVRNAAYGTKTHIEAIKQYGPCVHHRKKFITRIVTNE